MPAPARRPSRVHSRPPCRYADCGRQIDSSMLAVVPRRGPDTAAARIPISCRSLSQTDSITDVGTRTRRRAYPSSPRQQTTIIRRSSVTGLATRSLIARCSADAVSTVDDPRGFGTCTLGRSSRCKCHGFVAPRSDGRCSIRHLDGRVCSVRTHDDRMRCGSGARAKCSGSARLASNRI